MSQTIHVTLEQEDAMHIANSDEPPAGGLDDRSTKDAPADSPCLGIPIGQVNTSDGRQATPVQDTSIQAEVAYPAQFTPVSWFAMDEAVVGLAHRAQNTPCQDAAIAQHAPRPFIVLADGAGSAAVSDIGAQAVVTGIARLIQTLEGQWLTLLDSAESVEGALAVKWPMLMVKHARGILADTAQMHRREIRDLRCTLLCAIVGQKRIMWLKVGDGEIVVERTECDHVPVLPPHCYVLGERGKGDFVNQTTFIDTAKPEDVQWGIESSQSISGLAAMSDGAAERLVATNGLKVATRVSKLLEALRNQQLKRQHLTQLFYSTEFCQRSSGDDRSMALLACQLVAPPQSDEPVLQSEAVVSNIATKSSGTRQRRPKNNSNRK